MWSKNLSIYILVATDAIDTIESYAWEISMEEFYENTMCHDACLMQFQHLGETLAKMTREFPHEFPKEIFEAIGFRNFIAHDYIGIELATVYDTIFQDLPVLRKVLNSLL